MEDSLLWAEATNFRYNKHETYPWPLKNRFCFQSGQVLQTSDGRIFRVTEESSRSSSYSDEGDDSNVQEDSFAVVDAARNAERPLADTKEVREEHLMEDEDMDEVEEDAEITSAAAERSNNQNQNQNQNRNVVLSAPLTTANARFVSAAAGQTFISHEAHPTTSQFFTSADGRTFQIAGPQRTAAHHILATSPTARTTVVTAAQPHVLTHAAPATSRTIVHPAAATGHFVTVNGARFAASAFPGASATDAAVPVFTQSTPLFSNQVRAVAANNGFSLAGTGSVSRGFLVLDNGDVSYQF